MDNTTTPEVSEFSTDDLRNALGNLPADFTPEAQPASPEADSPTPQQESGVAGEETIDAGEEAPLVEPVSETLDPAPQLTEEEKLAKMRIRPRNPLDQQVMDLYKSEGFSGTFAEAASIIYGQKSLQPPTTPQREEIPPAPAPVVADPIQTLEEEITALNTQMLEAAENFETAKALQIQQQIYDKKFEVREAQMQVQREREARMQEQQMSYRQKAEHSRDTVLQRYPVLADKNSVERKHLDAFVAEKQNDPDYQAIFDSPIWPELMVDAFNRQTNSLRAAPRPAAVPPANPAQAARAKVLTTGDVASPQTIPTPEALERNLSTMKSSDLMSLLGNAQ